MKMYGDAFPTVGDLEVLGYPLLAHLAMKVMANFREDLSQLIIPPTTLYRHLVDLTCKRGGKYPATNENTTKGGHIEGKDLRALLHGTALAITAHGSESIPEGELELRLETLGVGKDIFQSTREHPLSNLMISFYFKGTHDQAGCEFLHKSFREYLAAEAIVEVLKEYSKIARETPPEKPNHLYWQDFRSEDPRHWLARKLGEVLAPQWLSREITSHLSTLIAWETLRAKSGPESPALTGGSGVSTDPVTALDWCRIRDGLADLWDWWGEGVHLRPQPTEKSKVWYLESPYVLELVKLAMRRINFNRRNPPRPIRTTTVDAHLGYGLFQLSCLVHEYICEADGWPMEAGPSPEQRWKNIERPRRYQVALTPGKTKYIQFAPSGVSPYYFRHYAGRISGAGVAPFVTHNEQRYRLDFPSRTVMRGIYLGDADLSGLSFSQSDMSYCDLENANLAGTEFGETTLSGSNLARANLFGAHLYKTHVEGATIAGANLFMTDLRHTPLSTLSGLSQDQLNITLRDGGFEVPTGLAVPGVWREFAKAHEKSKRAREASQELKRKADRPVAKDQKSANAESPDD